MAETFICLKKYILCPVIIRLFTSSVPSSDTGVDKDLPTTLQDQDMTCYAENLDYMTCHWPSQGPGVGYQLTVTPQ